MWTLGIESATLQGGIALVRDGRLVEEAGFEHGMVHGRELVPAVEGLLKRHLLRVRDLALVACDIGPGSYTGLRVGLATAKGLCRFSGASLIGVCSLDAMADEYAARHSELVDGAALCPAIDAKWNQIYHALYRIRDGRAVREEPPTPSRPRNFPRRDSSPIVFGDACETFARELTAAGVTLDASKDHHRPRASRVALRGALDYTGGRADTVEGLEPLYLRPTEAELKFRKSD